MPPGRHVRKRGRGDLVLPAVNELVQAVNQLSTDVARGQRQRFFNAGRPFWAKITAEPSDG